MTVKDKKKKAIPKKNCDCKKKRFMKGMAFTKKNSKNDPDIKF